MAKVNVIGSRTVGGIAPGKSGELDLPEANLRVLEKGHHIERVPDRPAPARKAAPVADTEPETGAEGGS